MSLNQSSSTHTTGDNEQFSFALDPIEDSADCLAEHNLNTVDSVDSETSQDDLLGGEPTIKTESIWVSMPNGEQLHMRHLLPLSDTNASPKRVFMLHGEVECGRIFYHESGKGAAYYFAKQGYEVFVADLGGRGRSLGCDGEPSSLTVHDIVTDAIPRLLRAATQHYSLPADDNIYSLTPSVAPTIWVAHGFGGVLLSAAWARMAEAERTATQMIFFGARRQLQARHRIANAFVKAFCHPLTAKLVNWHNAFPATRMRLGSADENTHWFRVYADWISSDSWCDSEDGFDYQAALQANPVPPTLHFATVADKIYSGVADVRAFIKELGCHDARMIVADTIAGTKRKYDHLSLLLDPAAVDDIFSDANNWLLEQAGDSSVAMNEPAVADAVLEQAFSAKPLADNEPSADYEPSAEQEPSANQEPLAEYEQAAEACKEANLDLPFTYPADDEILSSEDEKPAELSLAG